MMLGLKRLGQNGTSKIVDGGMLDEEENLDVLQHC